MLQMDAVQGVGEKRKKMYEMIHRLSIGADNAAMRHLKYYDRYS